jgi:hypothetical protein
MTDDATPTEEVPYHAWETRILQDSEGRTIEFRQLIPGSPDPGPAHFQEMTGVTHLMMTIHHPTQGQVSRSVPVRFNIPYGDGGVPDPAAAFKVFDKLAEKAAEEAKEDLDAKIAAEKRAAASKIIVAPAGVHP